MIASVCWKELREQRGLWLAIALLAVLFCVAFGLGASSAAGSPLRDNYVRGAVIGALFSLMVAQGVVCGAQLMAGEKEAGTLALLDILARQRAPVWSSKLIAGSLLTLAQALLLFGCLLYLQLGAWTFLAPLVLVGWLALLWGMVSGSLCEQVFPAVLTGILLTLGSLGLSILMPIGGEVVQLGLAFVALGLSRQTFCTTDRQRRRHAEDMLPDFPTAGPSSWHTLAWLSERQGRMILWPGLGVSFVAGFFVQPAPELLWPLATLVIGLVCGWAVFVPEQTGEQERFLGAQRFPPGRVWLVKTLCWGLAALAMHVLLFLAMILRHAHASGGSSRPLFSEISAAQRNLGLFMTLWSIHGFCFGQLASLLSRKTVVIAVLGIGSSGLMLACWLPSLLMGGLPAWQVLAIPVLVLGVTRLSLWDWFAGRLYTRGHLVRLLGGATLAAACMAAVLWQRAYQVPDVAEPFDVHAFEARLDGAARSEAGPLILRPARSLDDFLKKTRARLGPPTKRVFPAPADTDELPAYVLEGDYLALCLQVLERGWPAEDAELARWLDAVFAGEWARDVRAAVQQPPGLLLDPRGDNRSGGMLREVQKTRPLGLLFAVRALHLQARGNGTGALDHLQAALGLARQIRHASAALPFLIGLGVENTAYQGLDQWFQRAGPHAERWRAAQELLERHEREIPDPLDNLKAEYLQTRRYLTWGLEQPYLVHWALEAPWEQQRHTRLRNALFQARMAQLAAPGPRLQGQRAGDVFSCVAHEHGLPLPDGPTAQLTAQTWGRIIAHAHVGVGAFDPHNYVLHNRRNLRLRQIYIALALYQIDKGQAAPNLDELAPRYLAAVPLDPVTAQPFSYKVSGGEEIHGRFPIGVSPRTENLQLGQGVLWLDRAHPHTSDDRPWYFPVPLWRPS